MSKIKRPPKRRPTPERQFWFELFTVIGFVKIPQFENLKGASVLIEAVGRHEIDYPTGYVEHSQKPGLEFYAPMKHRKPLTPEGYLMWFVGIPFSGQNLDGSDGLLFYRPGARTPRHADLRMRIDSAFDMASEFVVHMPYKLALKRKRLRPELLMKRLWEIWIDAEYFGRNAR